MDDRYQEGHAAACAEVLRVLEGDAHRHTAKLPEPLRERLAQFLAPVGDSLGLPHDVDALRRAEVWARTRSERADDEGRDQDAAQLRGLESACARGLSCAYEVGRLRAELRWHEERSGTRAEQEAEDADDDATWAQIVALTPEQLDAEMVALGLDPEQVRREAEVTARLAARLVQASARADAAEARLAEMERERDELRLTLATFDDPERTYAAVNAERIRQGISWRELARTLGISSSGLTRWGQGKSLSQSTYLAVCGWLRAAMIAADAAVKP